MRARYHSQLCPLNINSMKFLINIICATIITLSLAISSYVFAQQYSGIKMASYSSINAISEELYTDFTNSNVLKILIESKYYKGIERLLIQPINESILEINLHIKRYRHKGPKVKKGVTTDAKLSYMSYVDFYLLSPQINYQPSGNLKISASMMLIKSSDDFHFGQNVLTHYSVNMNLNF